MKPPLIKIIFITVVLSLLAVMTWLAVIDVFFLTQDISDHRAVTGPTPLKELEPTEKAPRVADQPLTKITLPEATVDLTSDGIIDHTNQNREAVDIESLSSNPKLDRAAELKLDDMLEREYFDHYGPDGSMGSDQLAELVDYQYLSIGENLAWGYFADDQDVVDAWMDSPGHRENILKAQYREIGVATELVEFQGQTGWLAVQIFGRPRSDCLEPDSQLVIRIENNNESIVLIQNELEEMMEEIHQAADAEMTKRQYNQLIKNYNQTVEEYNELIKNNRALVEEYNSQIDKFNVCVKS